MQHLGEMVIFTLGSFNFDSLSLSLSLSLSRFEIFNRDSIECNIWKTNFDRFPTKIKQVADSIPDFAVNFLENVGENGHFHVELIQLLILRFENIH